MSRTLRMIVAMIALAATFVAANQPAGAQDDTQASLCVPLEAVIDSSQQIQFGDAAGIADTGYVGELIVRFRPSAPSDLLPLLDELDAFVDDVSDEIAAAGGIGVLTSEQRADLQQRGAAAIAPIVSYHDVNCPTPSAQLSPECSTGPLRVPALLIVRPGSQPVDVVAGSVEATLDAFVVQMIVVPSNVGVDDVTLNGESAGVSVVDGPACPSADFLAQMAITFQVHFTPGCATSKPPVAPQLEVTEQYPGRFPFPFTVDLVADGELFTVDYPKNPSIELPANAVAPRELTFDGIPVKVIVEPLGCDPPSSGANPSSANDGAPNSVPLAPKFTG